jgi:hypothetical protein
MKISKEQLKAIIKEELGALGEAADDTDWDSPERRQRDSDIDAMVRRTRHKLFGADVYGDTQEARQARQRAAAAMVKLAGSLKMAGKSIGRHPDLQSGGPGGTTYYSVRDLPELLEGLKQAVADVEDMIRAYK